jgi:ETC complex I subunit conserved region
MPRARIYKPARTAMQSGQAKTKEWVLEFEPRDAKRPDPLMGWAGSSDTLDQVTLRFATRDEAIGYANKHGIDFEFEMPHTSKLKPKSYADNFRYDRVR